MLKIVLIAAVVMAFAYQIASSRGLPIVLVILAVLISLDPLFGILGRVDRVVVRWFWSRA